MKKFYIALACLASVLILSVCLIVFWMHESSKTPVTPNNVESTVSDNEALHIAPIVDKFTADTFYEHPLREDVKADVESDDKYDYQLLIEEDIPIHFTPPTYDPDKRETYEMQMRVTDGAKMSETFLFYIVDFMLNTRGVEDYTLPTQFLNLYGYYGIVYVTEEIPEYGHNIKWKFILGDFTDTPDDMYTILVYRADIYFDGYTGVKEE